MNVACLTQFQLGPFHDRLADELRARGHTYTYVNTQSITPSFANDDFDIYTHALVPQDKEAWGLVERLRTENRIVVRPLRSVKFDKVSQIKAMQAAGIPLPRSKIASDMEGAVAAATKLGYPLIAKAHRSHHGKNVRFITNEAALQAFVDEAQGIGPAFVLQEVVQPLGRDVRAFVVNNKVVAAMERFAAEGDFCANYTLSEKADPTTLSAEEEDVVLRVMALYNLPYAGIDFARSATGPVVFEINKSPAVRGIEAVTGINVAGAIVDYFEELFAAKR